MLIIITGKSFSMRLDCISIAWTALMFLGGVLCNSWKAEYLQQRICAVKGSTVAIPCLFYHPANLRVKSVAWGHVKSRHLQGRVVFSTDLKAVTPRFQYIGDKHHNCSLKIHHVMHNDAGKYIIIFNSRISRWPVNVGPSLKVVDLKAVVTRTNGNRTLKEGDSVNLTCINSCDDDDGDLSSAFTWFKNGKPINDQSALYFGNISPIDAGNYTCSLRKHNGTTSRVMRIDVEFSPKNTTVYVRPSMEEVTGSNITLICSSCANPPVENYTWFKMGADDIVDVGHQPVFLADASGQYLCSASNKHGSQNSSVVTLKIQVNTRYWARKVFIVATVPSVALLLTVAAAVVVRLNYKKTWAPQMDCVDDTQNTDYVNWFNCDHRQAQEESHSEGGATELVYASVHFHDSRTSNMQQQMDSHDNDMIYSTVFSAETNQQ